MFHKIKKIIIPGILVLVLLSGWTSHLPAAGEKHVIVIDPAHGGKDTGVKITDKINEKDITLALALALRKELSKENNIEVIFTRESDFDLTQEKRKKIVQDIKPEFFLSIHINCGFGKNASGFELYYPGFDKDAQDGRKEAKEAGQAKIKHLSESVRMAHLLQRNLDALFPRKGRGLREADIPVLEGLPAPGLIVEIGFASNSEDKKKLLSPKTQVEIAKAMNKSIVSFFR